MAHLSSSLPFHKITPFEFPHSSRRSLETNIDTTRAHKAASNSGPFNSDFLQGESPQTFPSPTPPSRFRRGSSITYNNPGLRESLDRTVRRGVKSLIIVIPPSTFNHEHGRLGHTLSSGPSDRLSQGILMPLFPTMHAQLAAIAREYNFPSTAGICLYLHFTDNGITMTPRISDESWQIIWSQVLETPHSNPVQSSIVSGKVEFDLDMCQARWYTSWLSSAHRDRSEPRVSISRTTPPVTHLHKDSGTTQAEDDVFGNFVDDVSNHHAVPHLPRKLSLVERYDLSLSQSAEPVSRSTIPPPENIQLGLTNLSPILQEEELRSVKHDLESRVNSWRASALGSIPLVDEEKLSHESVFPLASAGNISMPKAENGLNFDEFAWSVSSIGPEDNDIGDQLSLDRAPSVDIGHRAKGSVSMTLSERTSSGPPDYASDSSEPSFYRLPSPDLAHRMYEYVPSTPLTATSWGAPSSLPSPRSHQRLPSPDLAHRMYEDVPMTPFTATSWGPSSYFPSPHSSYRLPSPDLAYRMYEDVPVTPLTVTSWGPPSYPPSPCSSYRSPSLDIGDRVIFSRSETPLAECGYAEASDTDGKINSRTLPVEDQLIRRVFEDDSASYYPHVNPYKAVYPHFDLYPVISVARNNASSSSRVGSSFAVNSVIMQRQLYPTFDLYPDHSIARDVSTFTESSGRLSICVRFPLQYPIFDIYPAVYPYVLPYPHVKTPSTSSLNSHQSSQHLHRDKCSNGTFSATEHPHLDLYPSTSLPMEPVSFDKRIELPIHSTRYPVFDLYPVVYPAFNIYPVIEGIFEPDFFGSGSNPLQVLPPQSSTLKNSAIYSISDIHPILSNRAPKSVLDGLAPYHPDFDIYPASSRKLATSYVERILPVYPEFNLYPLAYPHFDLYPPPQNTADYEHKAVESGNHYPLFSLYPAAYPYFDLWPSISPHPLTVVDPLTEQIQPDLLTNERALIEHPIVPSGDDKSDDTYFPDESSTFSSFDDSILFSVADTTPSAASDDEEQVQEFGIAYIPLEPDSPPTLHKVAYSPNLSIDTRRSFLPVSPTSSIHRLSPTARSPRFSSSSEPPSAETEASPATPTKRSSISSRLPIRKPSFKGMSSIADKQPVSRRSSSMTSAEDRKPNQLESAFVTLRKRDSLVLRRVKAYDYQASASLETLSNTPTSPRGPRPLLPKGMNRSKYPFAS